MQLTTKLVAIALALGGIGFGSAVQAGAIITNGTVTLGVRDLGDLNQGGGPPATGSGTTIVGLRSNATGSDSTSPGCTCEGWGVAIVSQSIAGFANSANVTSGLGLVSFTSTASTAVSTVNVLGPGSVPALRVTQDYHPIAGTPNLYEVLVSITNLTGSTLASGDLRYRRVMDWDIPSPGQEFVSIQGVPAALGLANGNNIVRTDNNGFDTANPLSFTPFATSGPLALTNQNFTDINADHGALFDFEFESLANGATRTFAIYYGVAPTKAAADIARSLVDGDATDVDIGLYSYGVCGSGLVGCNVATGAPNTFIFGFGATGGVLVIPGPGPTPGPSAPEPGTLALIGLGFAAVAFGRRRRA